MYPGMIAWWKHARAESGYDTHPGCGDVAPQTRTRAPTSPRERGRELRERVRGRRQRLRRPQASSIPRPQARARREASRGIGANSQRFEDRTRSGRGRSSTNDSGIRGPHRRRDVRPEQGQRNRGRTREGGRAPNACEPAVASALARIHALLDKRAARAPRLLLLRTGALMILSSGGFDSGVRNGEWENQGELRWGRERPRPHPQPTASARHDGAASGPQPHPTSFGSSRWGRERPPTPADCVGLKPRVLAQRLHAHVR